MIEEPLIDSVCSAVERGKRVNRVLPGGGKIAIDQPLPYICVYRYKQDQDPYFTRLLKTQAAYLIVEQEVAIRRLLTCMATSVVKKFNSFLILELWMNPDHDSSQFDIFCPVTRAPATVKTLKAGLQELSAFYPTVSVKVHDTHRRHPDSLDPLLTLDEAKELGVLQIGLRVPLIYEESVSRNPFALFFRKFRAKLSEVIKKAAFEFIRVQTSDGFTHYLTLGKTQLDNRIRFADRQLAAISEKMNFLMRVTPVNDAHEWESFKKNHFERPPKFAYRLISIDPELEKRKLYRIDIQKIDDPTLAHIFRDKRLELEKQLTMLEERETRNFRHIGQSLYGPSNGEVLKAADDILGYLSEEKEEYETVNCYTFADEAQKEIDQYRHEFPRVDMKVEIRKDVSGIMVSKGHLLLSEDFSLSSARVEALLQHEVGTHILTYCNGYRQPLAQMYAGFAGYDELQEGLAVLSEYLVGGLTPERLKILAGRVKAVNYMISGAEFIETFRMLKDTWEFGPRTSYNIAMRVFRGGGLTKDAIYLAGLIQLLDYLKKGGDFEILYSGKFHLRHVPVIEELMHRKILKAPYIAPALKLKHVQARLEKARSATGVMELLN